MSGGRFVRRGRRLFSAARFATTAATLSGRTTPLLALSAGALLPLSAASGLAALTTPALAGSACALLPGLTSTLAAASLEVLFGLLDFIRIEPAVLVGVVCLEHLFPRGTARTPSSARGATLLSATLYATRSALSTLSAASGIRGFHRLLTLVGVELAVAIGVVLFENLLARGTLSTTRATTTLP